MSAVGGTAGGPLVVTAIWPRICLSFRRVSMRRSCVDGDLCLCEAPWNNATLSVALWNLNANLKPISTEPNNCVRVRTVRITTYCLLTVMCTELVLVRTRTARRVCVGRAGRCWRTRNTSPYSSRTTSSSPSSNRNGTAPYQVTWPVTKLVLVAPTHTLSDVISCQCVAPCSGGLYWVGSVCGGRGAEPWWGVGTWKSERKLMIWMK